MCNGLREEVSRLRSLETVAAERADRMKRMASLRLASLRDTQSSMSIGDVVAVVHVIDGNNVRWMVKIQQAAKLRLVLDVVQNKYSPQRVMLCIDGPLMYGGTIVDPAQNLIDLGAAATATRSGFEETPLHRLWVEPL